MPGGDKVMPAGSGVPLEEMPKTPPILMLLGKLAVKSCTAPLPTAKYSKPMLHASGGAGEGAGAGGALGVGAGGAGAGVGADCGVSGPPPPPHAAISDTHPNRLSVSARRCFNRIAQSTSADGARPKTVAGVSFTRAFRWWTPCLRARRQTGMPATRYESCVVSRLLIALPGWDVELSRWLGASGKCTEGVMNAVSPPSRAPLGILLGI